MANPPSDAPVLFDVECDSSTIKQRKDGSYELVMEDVQRVHWETDTAKAKDGYYKAKRYAKNYDNYYDKNAEVNAYATFALADGSKEKYEFTITDVNYKKKSNKLIYDIEPFNNEQADKITGIEGETQSESAVFSTERTRWRPDWMDGSSKYLRGRILRGADLRGADLGGAYLDGALLRRADLRGADLVGANLRGANISHADLSGADLYNADLKRANLSRADLSGANLRYAVLWRTDLRGVTHLNSTINADLAAWFETTCPDGYLNIGGKLNPRGELKFSGQPCSEIF